MTENKSETNTENENQKEEQKTEEVDTGTYEDRVARALMSQENEEDEE